MDRRSCGQSFSDALSAELQHLAMLAGIAPATVGSHVLQTGSRSRNSKARRKFGQSSRLWSNQSLARFELAGCRCTPRRQSGMIQKRPTKLWSETYGALPLSYSATHLELRWWESNPRPPAFKACTPSRQSACFHWPGDEGMVRRIALPLSYTHHRIYRVSDRNRTDNRCTPTGSRRSQSHFSKVTANEENGSDATLNRCSPNRQLAVRDAGGNRTHLKPGCSRLPGHWAPASSILVRSRT
jgi:hypothetical protein